MCTQCAFVVRVFCVNFLRKKRTRNKKESELRRLTRRSAKDASFPGFFLLSYSNKTPEMPGVHLEGNFLPHVGRESFLVKYKQTSKAAHPTIFWRSQGKKRHTISSETFSFNGCTHRSTRRGRFATPFRKGKHFSKSLNFKIKWRKTLKETHRPSDFFLVFRV